VLHVNGLARVWAGAPNWNAGRENSEETGRVRPRVRGREAAQDVGWQTRKRIAREYRLVKGFAGKRGNGELGGGEGAVNGAAGKAAKARKRFV